MALAVTGLYLYNLDGFGVVDPDEPRYEAIGEAMAHTHQFVTPVLWGSPWFEKPPLLYWMTALGTATGLNPDMAGRLPVALLSLAFLAVSFALVRREFGLDAGELSLAVLATCLGWTAFSSLCLTDLPVAACFVFAVFLALPLLRASPDLRHAPVRFAAIGALLGLGTLAKGLVPVALAVPFLWFLRRYWKNWWQAVVAFLMAAAPWYYLVYKQNGYPFIQEFFLKHHFERLYSASLQHVQPWYYYFPVIVAGLFPWFPLLGLLAMRHTVWDGRRKFLAAIFCFGFLLFSVSLNKLPGYLLPLLPCAAALVGSQFEEKPLSQLGRMWLGPCAVLIALIPILSQVLAPSLAEGRLSFPEIQSITRTEVFYILLPVATLFVARKSWLVPLMVLCVTACGIFLKHSVDPVLDREVSPRGLYREQVKNLPGELCDGGNPRRWIYGLSFYRGRFIPPCGPRGFDFKIESRGHEIPKIISLR